MSAAADAAALTSSIPSTMETDPSDEARKSVPASVQRRDVTVAAAGTVDGTSATKPPELGLPSAPACGTAQSTTLPSRPALTSALPSGEKAVPTTASEWPRSGAPSPCPALLLRWGGLPLRPPSLTPVPYGRAWLRPSGETEGRNARLRTGPPFSSPMSRTTEGGRRTEPPSSVADISQSRAGSAEAGGTAQVTA